MTELSEAIERAARELADDEVFRGLLARKARETAAEIGENVSLVHAAIADKVTETLREDIARELIVKTQIAYGNRTRARKEMAALLGYSSYQAVEKRFALGTVVRMGRGNRTGSELENEMRDYYLRAEYENRAVEDWER